NGPQPVGNISVVRWEQEGQVPIVGYCLGRRWWHQGIMTEALGAVISFLFEQVGVERIRAYHDTNNPHSGGVMRKCGMTFQGIREKSDRNNQGVCDAAHYSIEREDR
ncbi:MAG: GNAT family N-acetyltransferase, partial [Oscillospiraceae bacterium]|nr:GNAT family N-acetyltransferase [Oscillospiraceae bacterium]